MSSSGEERNNFRMIVTISYLLGKTQNVNLRPPESGQQEEGRIQAFSKTPSRYNGTEAACDHGPQHRHSQCYFQVYVYDHSPKCSQYM